MKNRTIFKVLVFAFVIIIMNSSIVAAGGNKSDFSGERNIMLPGLFHGAEWYTGPDDFIAELRCRVINFDLDTDDLRVTGLQTIVLNSSQRQTEPYSTGRIWGKFVIEPAAYPGSYWTGHFFGKAKADGAWYHRYFGHGTGELEGLKFRAYIENTNLTSPGPPIPLRTWSVEGFIIE